MTELNPQAKAILDAMAASGQPTLDQLSPPDARAAFAEAFKMVAGEKPDVQVTDRQWQGPSASHPLRVYRPKGAAADARLPAVAYFHGGGWVICDIDTHDTACRVLCESSGCAILSFEYRWAPEHKFPAAAQDCSAALPWVAENADELGVDMDRFAVAGDSAGGNLAAVAALAARDAGGPKLRHQALIFPAADMAADTESYRRNVDGYFLTGALMKYFIDHYLNSPDDVNDWRASPLRAASHADLPPATILVAGFDPLCDDGLNYAQALENAGGRAEVVRYDDMIHDFTLMDGAIPEGRVAMQKVGTALGKALG